MIKAVQKGFTLIELAIVIAILGILAAVALNNLGNTQASAECAMIKDMAAQLSSGYGVYTAAEGATPTGFDKYVVTTAPPLTPGAAGVGRVNPNISLYNFGPNAAKGTRCAVASGAAGTITCTSTFNSYNATYTFNNGAVTYAATAVPSTGPACP